MRRTNNIKNKQFSVHKIGFASSMLHGHLHGQKSTKLVREKVLILNKGQSFGQSQELSLVQESDLKRRFSFSEPEAR